MDSAQLINFDECQELAISEIGVHTRINMINMEDTVNQLKSFFVDSSPITVGDFTKNEVIIPKNKHGTECSKEYSNAYDLATTALSPKLGAAKNFVMRSNDSEADLRIVNYHNGLFQD